MPRGLNPYDEAQLQRRLWTPGNLQPIGWFDSADIATISTPNGVSAWGNKGIAGGAATKSTVSERPAFSPTGFNGFACLSFDGGDQLVHTITQASAMTIFCLWINTLSQTAYRGVCAFGEQGAGGGTMLLARGLSSFVSTHGSGGDVVSSLPYSIGTPQIIALADNNDGSGFWRANGADAGTFSGNNPIGQTPGHIGGLLTSSQGNAMLLAEIVVLDRPATSYECEKVEAAILWKRNLSRLLPASHPFRNRPPLIGD